MEADFVLGFAVIGVSKILTPEHFQALAEVAVTVNILTSIDAGFPQHLPGNAKKIATNATKRFQLLGSRTSLARDSAPGPCLGHSLPTSSPTFAILPKPRVSG